MGSAFLIWCNYAFCSQQECAGGVLQAGMVLLGDTAGLLPYMGKHLHWLRRLEFRGVTSQPTTSPRIWIKKFHFFLVGFELLWYFLESEVSHDTSPSANSVRACAAACVKAKHRREREREREKSHVCVSIGLSFISFSSDTVRILRELGRNSQRAWTRPVPVLCEDINKTKLSVAAGCCSAVHLDSKDASHHRGLHKAILGVSGATLFS